jgi:YQGE family putative transporter
MKTVLTEWAYFKSHAHPMRVLLLANFVYSLVLPVIELFVGAFIIRNSGNFNLVMVFQLAQGTGIPCAFFLNGFLLNRFSIVALYTLGMILSGISMSVMMLLPGLNTAGVSAAGLIMGLSYGFFWANRVLLTLNNTKDETRNYYYGLETFFNTTAFVIMPFLAGAFISTVPHWGWFNGSINAAYYVLTALVFVLIVGASLVVWRAEFRNPPKSPFLYFRFHILWRKMLGLSALKGFAQGYIIAAPVMLVMHLVGSEGSLGAIQSMAALISAVLLYFLGRMSAANHRLRIFTAGLTLFMIGAYQIPYCTPPPVL